MTARALAMIHDSRRRAAQRNEPELQELLDRAARRMEARDAARQQAMSTARAVVPLLIPCLLLAVPALAQAPTAEELLQTIADGQAADALVLHDIRWLALATVCLLISITVAVWMRRPAPGRER